MLSLFISAPSDVMAERLQLVFSSPFVWVLDPLCRGMANLLDLLCVLW